MNFTLIAPEKKEEEYVLNRPGKHAFFFYNSQANVTFRLTSENIYLYLYALFQVSDNTSLSLTTVQVHEAPRCYSKMVVKALLGGSSSVFHRGMIRILPIASNSQAYLQHDSLLLSPSARARSIPSLEIMNKDVICTHGATVIDGSLLDVSYLCSRGLCEKSACRVLTMGFVESIFQDMSGKGFTTQADTIRREYIDDNYI